MPSTHTTRTPTHRCQFPTPRLHQQARAWSTPRVRTLSLISCSGIASTILTEPIRPPQRFRNLAAHVRAQRDGLPERVVANTARGKPSQSSWIRFKSSCVETGIPHAKFRSRHHLTTPHSWMMHLAVCNDAPGGSVSMSELSSPMFVFKKLCSINRSRSSSV